MTTLPEALEAFPLLPDWESRFEHLIELAAVLPPMPGALQTDENKVRGCTSQVWMLVGWNGTGDDAKLNLHLESDAMIVRGLLVLVWLAYNGKTRAEMAQIDLPTLLKPTGLLTQLSPNRRNGFASVLATLKELAKG